VGNMLRFRVFQGSRILLLLLSIMHPGGSHRVLDGMVAWDGLILFLSFSVMHSIGSVLSTISV
jgi:hypothetical protein